MLLGYLVQVEWIISFVMMRIDSIFHINILVRSGLPPAGPVRGSPSPRPIRIAK